MQLYSGTSTVSLYTANGGYSDKYQNADSWTQIFSHDYSSSDREFIHTLTCIDSLKEFLIFQLISWLIFYSRNKNGFQQKCCC